MGTWYYGRKLKCLLPSPHEPDPPFVEQLAYSSRDLPSEIGGDSIADLNILLGSAATEEVVVWERLETCGFPDRDAPALARIGDE